MTRIVAIAVVGTNGIIGDGIDQPFKFAEDWKRFKRVTTGHPLIMGRRTHDAIGDFLPGRTTIVVTRDPASVAIPPGVDAHVAASLDEALALASELDDTVFVGGGGTIYRQAWDRLTDLDLTEVHASAEGTVRFPDLDPDEWVEVRREPRGEFDFVGYARVSRTPRLTLVPLTGADLAEWTRVHTDPRLYRHAPKNMETDPARIAEAVAFNAAAWARDGLGYWKVLDAATREPIGFGGVRRTERDGASFWNLYYRIAVERQGEGLATELAMAALAAAASVDPQGEVRAYVRHNNPASAEVARRAGLVWAHDVPDQAGADQAVYCNRPVGSA